MIRDPVPIVAINTPERDGWTHHIFGQIPRQTLILCRHIALLHVRHKPFAISRVTGIDKSIDRRSPHPLPEHRQQIPLPFLAQQAIGYIVQMPPLAGLAIPSATGGDDMQMGIVLPIAPMGLDNHDVAALEGVATDSGEDIIQALDATTHERAQQDMCVLIEGGA